jgi:hypothetical protein
MSIDTRWEDENGNEIEVVLSPPRSRFETLIPEANVEGFPCLRYIDLYGNTTFNQLQLPQLLADLKQAILQAESPETRAHMESLIDLVQRAIGVVHTYIKFYGD